MFKGGEGKKGARDKNTLPAMVGMCFPKFICWIPNPWKWRYQEVRLFAQVKRREPSKMRWAHYKSVLFVAPWKIFKSFLIPGFRHCFPFCARKMRRPTLWPVLIPLFQHQLLEKALDLKWEFQSRQSTHLQERKSPVTEHPGESSCSRCLLCGIAESWHVIFSFYRWEIWESEVDSFTPASH